MANQRYLAAGIAAIAALTFLVYLPILPGSFLMDDARLTGSDNPLVNGHLTPYSLWFQTDFTLATFGWWIEHIIFGANPAGDHAVNIALHAASAVLLWRLLARLKVPGAWLAGALYAVHPVCVNSVARIAELKNTLSMPFFLLSFLGYLRYETLALYPPETAPGESARAGGRRGRATLWYMVALVSFVLALLAKTTVVMLPVLILFGAMWRRKRITRKDWMHTLPFFVLSLGFGLMSVWFQKHQALPSAAAPLPPASFMHRLAGAGDVFWFYLGKALWPVNLCIEYARWNINARSVAAYLPDLAAGAVFLFCLMFRRSWGRHVLFGLGSFLVMLFPALGFFDAQYLTVWQVSDHLEYTALAAVVALVAAGCAILPGRPVGRWMGILLLAGASVLCFNRAEVFSTPEKLMADTVAKNPRAADGHNELGVLLAKKGDYSGAIDELKLAVKYGPANFEARLNLGHALALEGETAAAETQYLAALKLKPASSQAHSMYGELLEHEGRSNEALQQLRLAAAFNPDAETLMKLASLDYALGHWADAAGGFRRAVLLQPTPAELNDLAWILATCPEDSVRNGSEAVRDAEQACRLTGFKEAGMMGTLAAAYAEDGQFSNAVTTAETTIQLATDAGNSRFAAINRQLLSLYRTGKPYHASP